MLEQAILTGATAPDRLVAATMAAARKALALKRARQACRGEPIALRHGLLARAVTAVPVDPAPAAGPRRTAGAGVTDNHALDAMRSTVSERRRSSPPPGHLARP